MKKRVFTLSESEAHAGFGNDKRRSAFTLAETLITLLVIGVVAALTIPALMQTWQNRQYATAKNKAMATIGNGYKLMIAENDGTTAELPLLKCGDDFECLAEVHRKSFQIGADKTKTHEGFAEKYTKHGDSSEEAGFKWDDVPYIFTTNDGMTYGNLGGFTVVVDVNGAKAPNKICKDVYKFIYEDGSIKDVAADETALCEDLDNSVAATIPDPSCGSLSVATGDMTDYGYVEWYVYGWDTGNYTYDEEKSAECMRQGVPTGYSSWLDFCQKNASSTCFDVSIDSTRGELSCMCH